jgi:tripartite-type tricarboxylate transporter receptor subunit TctC
MKATQGLHGLSAVIFVTVGVAAGPFQVEAQIFPSNPIRIVVPTAPSTPPDIISRVIATELANSEGWKVIVENRPGAVMTIAGSDVLKQPADGTSIYAMSVPVTAAPAFLPNMPFQLERDFTPVIKIATSYNVLVVNPASQISLRTGRSDKGSAGQANVLIGWVRNSSPFDRRDVQAQNRGARHTCRISNSRKPSVT